MPMFTNKSVKYVTHLVLPVSPVPPPKPENVLLVHPLMIVTTVNSVAQP
jgi:hypothetical protein